MVIVYPILAANYSFGTLALMEEYKNSQLKEKENFLPSWSSSALHSY